jgi:hypothetical protein
MDNNTYIEQDEFKNKINDKIVAYIKDIIMDENAQFIGEYNDNYIDYLIITKNNVSFTRVEFEIKNDKPIILAIKKL